MKVIKRVAVDTNVLTWWSSPGKQPKPAEVEIRNGSLLLLDQFDKANVQVVIPSVVLAELLTPVEPNARPEVVASLNKRCLLTSLDANGAMHAAEVFNRFRALSPEEKYGRVIVKADALIIGELIANGVVEFYSADEGCRRLASKFIRSCPALPTIPDNLFTQTD